MTKSDYYRSKAASAQTTAAGCREKLAKALWLEVSETWLRMIPHAERAEAEFAAEELAGVTGQVSNLEH